MRRLASGHPLVAGDVPRLNVRTAFPRARQNATVYGNVERVRQKMRDAVAQPGFSTRPAKEQ